MAPPLPGACAIQAARRGPDACPSATSSTSPPRAFRSPRPRSARPRTTSPTSTPSATPAKVVTQSETVVDGRGLGVRIDSIQSAYNAFLQKASLAANSQGGQSQVISDFLNQAQQMFGDPSSSTSFFAGLDNVYSAFSAASDTPSSSPQPHRRPQRGQQLPDQRQQPVEQPVGPARRGQPAGLRRRLDDQQHPQPDFPDQRQHRPHRRFGRRHLGPDQQPRLAAGPAVQADAGQHQRRRHRRRHHPQPGRRLSGRRPGRGDPVLRGGGRRRPAHGDPAQGPAHADHARRRGGRGPDASGGGRPAADDEPAQRICEPVGESDQRGAQRRQLRARAQFPDRNPDRDEHGHGHRRFLGQDHPGDHQFGGGDAAAGSTSTSPPATWT